MSDFSASFNAVIAYLDSKNFNYTSFPEEHRVTLTMSGRNASLRFTARITHYGDYLQVSANYPFLVRDEKLRPSVAELVTRANYCMPLGKFELDMKDGEVRFHVTHVIADTGLTPEMIERHFMTAYYTSDRYFPAFMQHIHAGYTPEDAIFHAELDTHAEMVEDNPKPKVEPKAKEKAGPAAAESKPRPKRVTRKKTSGGKEPGTPQGELPL